MKKIVMNCLGAVFVTGCMALGAAVGHYSTIDWIDKQFEKKEKGKRTALTWRFSEAYMDGYTQGRVDQINDVFRTSLDTDPYWKVICKKD